MALGLYPHQRTENIMTYNLVTSLIIDNKQVELYFSAFPPNRSSPFYAKEPTLDQAIKTMIEEQLEEEIMIQIGNNFHLVSCGFVELSMDHFFGDEPFALHPLPIEYLIKFSELYVKKWKEKISS